MGDILIEMKPKHDFLVCVDSDGCVFDNMELKHKECFCPATINIWGLQSVSRYGREAAEYVNLYSKSRGTNRYPALIETLTLLSQRKEAIERGYKMPDMTPLQKWIEKTPALSRSALQEYIKSNPDESGILEAALAWTKEVDDNIAHIVRNVAEFPAVKKTLEHIGQIADIVIVSATPHEAIVREWGEHGLLDYVTVVAGQELGSKAECIKKAYEGKYSADHVLMIGDAPGDHAAAEKNGVLFYPIIPGIEQECWVRMNNETAEKFGKLEYNGPYEQAMLSEFYSRLLDNPTW